jgi:hypothetical protein
MATAFTAQCSTYIQMKVDYTLTATSTGHSIYAEMYFRRTNSYSGSTYNNMTAKITIDGQSATVRNNTQFTIPGNNNNWISAGSTTKTVTHSAAKTITISGSSDAGSYLSGSGSGSVSLPAIASPPSGMAISAGTITWNTINLTGTVTSFGSGGSNPKMHLMAYNSNYTGWAGSPRAGYTYTDSTTSHSIALTNSNKWNADGGLDIVGCTSFKIGGQAETSVGTSDSNPTTVYWTPPAPVTTITKTAETPINATQNSVTIQAVGTTANNASGAKVTRIYRVSTNGTWGSWAYLANMALVDAGTAQSGTFNVAQNANIIVEIKDRYFEGNTTSGTVHDSEAKQFSFKSAMPKPTLTCTWNATRDTLSITASSISTAHNRMEINWGYDSTASTALAQSAAGATTLSGSIQYPNHGSNQKIYVKARLLTTDGTWLYSDTFQCDSPNPILGVSRKADGTQKYIVDIREKKWSRNLYKNALSGGVATLNKNDVIFTNNGDGTITANGTASSSFWIDFAINGYSADATQSGMAVNSGTTYIMSLKTPIPSNNVMFRTRGINQPLMNIIAGQTESNTWTCASTETGFACMSVSSGQTFNNVVIGIQVEAASRATHFVKHEDQTVTPAWQNGRRIVKN